VIDPLDSLTFSMHASRGGFALLLGSGVSRAATIPTGWEIVVDLLRKLAAVRGDSSNLDPAAWYQAEYGEEPKRFPFAGVPYDGSHLIARLGDYGAALERLQALVIVGAVWGEPHHQPMWQKALERLAHPPHPPSSFSVPWENCRLYPAIRLLYGAGIAAAASAKFATLRGFFEVPARIETGESAPLVLVGWRNWVVDLNTLRSGLGQRYYVPLSEHFFTTLREPLRDFIPADDEYERVFDLFEYLLGLTYIYYEDHQSGWFPPGRFVFKMSGTRGIRALAMAEADRLGPSWPVLQAGFFGGSPETFRKLDAALTAIIPEFRRMSF